MVATFALIVASLALLSVGALVWLILRVADEMTTRLQAMEGDDVREWDD